MTKSQIPHSSVTQYHIGIGLLILGVGIVVAVSLATAHPISTDPDIGAGLLFLAGWGVIAGGCITCAWKYVTANHRSS